MLKSESQAVILRLLLQALFLYTTTNTVTVTNLLLNFQNVSFSVDGVDYQSLPPQISSDSTANMFDNNPETHFEVAAGRISHSMTINIFLPSAMIQKISIQTESVASSSYTVSLQNDERTWLHRVGTDCRESYLRLVNNVYYQCLSYGSNVIVDLEDFYVAGNNNVTWWTVFNKLAITFNITINSTASIVIKDISALGSRFTAVGNVCNCFLPGVINANSPCDQQDRCLCRDDVGSRDCSTCKSPNSPYIYPTYGPIGGWQHVSLFQGSCWNFSAASKVYIGEESCDLAPKCITKAQICTRFRNIYPNGTYIDDASSKCCTGSYNESSVGLNLPVKVCWESFCVALDNIAYLLKANPVVNVMKRKSIMISGGIKVVFEGQNLNFAPNPTLLTQAFSGSSYIFESSVNLTDITKRVCTVNSEEKLMTCYTVNLNDRSISRDYATYIFAFSIYSKFSCDENIYLINEPGFIKFTLCPDPNISILYPYIRELPRDTDNPTVMISGNGLTGCTKDEFGLELADYQVMVQNVNAEVVDLKSNSILFRPPSTKPAGCYLNEACEIKVLVGSLKLVVGFIQYDRNWTPIILAAVLGSVGGILLIVLVVSIVCCAKRKKLCFKEKVIPKEVHEVRARSLLDDIDEPLRLKVQRCLVDAAHVIKQQEIGKGKFL
ncbi:hypothetical protein HELRODRAFT_192109 [Helobdella robusta]|uniref:Uncharacterized protein n=1 Tax=Helobdella robusta TaxID=6412 RepID=T1FTK9_HELRO|nr:hypothetical protein HELRODRAFT_192109 [Helobdella robusta]ESO03082.1 hypothetical protein HELRODRAFT_192109 [Helobdella robusta]